MAVIKERFKRLPVGHRTDGTHLSGALALGEEAAVPEVIKEVAILLAVLDIGAVTTEGS